MKAKHFFRTAIFAVIFFSCNAAFAQDFYSNGERLTEALNETWGTSSSWENNYHYVITYQTPTNLLLSTEQWNGFSWETIRKASISLYPNYAFNTIISQKWDGNQTVWKNEQRETYTYFNNDPAKLLVEKYDTANAVNNTLWDDNSRTTHSYNPNGLELQQIRESKNGTNWIGQYKKLSTYNANSLKVSETDFTWQSSSSTWRYNYKQIHSYNPNNLLALTIDSSTNGSSTPPFFNVARKTQYIYNASNLRMQELVTYFDYSTNTWSNHLFTKRTNTYNAQNQCTQINDELYDSNLGALALSSTTAYTYNNAGNTVTETYIGQTTPNESYRTTYTYSPFVSTENKASESFAVNIYPNPTAEQINVSLPEDSGVVVAMIMAANGQMIKAQNLTTTQSAINLQELPKGAYQVILLQNGKTAVKSFVKQ